MSTQIGSTPPAATPYDAVAYPSNSFPETHPNRLAAVGRLFGLAPVRPSAARVLELGCADGANLLPMADQFPGARFLGIDSSKVQIGAAQKAAEAAGLKNIELRCQDILEFSSAEGEFDYIIVHGIFSWVPDQVREKIMRICAGQLTENGVAYISYNTLPGWNMRRSLRDMVRFHTGDLADPKAKAQQIRALLAFLRESVPTDDNAYGVYLKLELEAMSGRLDGYLLHEFLEEENTAFYFHEFVARARRHGLQYLGETSLAQMLAANFPENVRKTLAYLGTDALAQEQYMDFVRNRMFRRTLLCRAERPVHRQVSRETMVAFSFQTAFKSKQTTIDLAPGVLVEFQAHNGQTIASADSVAKVTLQILAEAMPEVISYETLADRAREALRRSPGVGFSSAESVSEALPDRLLSFYAKGFVQIFAEPVNMAKAIPEKPALSPLLRYQALHSRLVANRLHYSVECDGFARVVVEACDGTRTRSGLVERVIDRVREGRIQVKEGTKPVTEDKQLRAFLGPQVDAVLNKLMEGGFLPG